MCKMSTLLSTVLLLGDCLACACCNILQWQDAWSRRSSNMWINPCNREQQQVSYRPNTSSALAAADVHVYLIVTRSLG